MQRRVASLRHPAGCCRAIVRATGTEGAVPAAALSSASAPVVALNGLLWMAAQLLGHATLTGGDRPGRLDGRHTGTSGSGGVRAACAGSPRLHDATGAAALERLCSAVEAGSEPALGDLGGEHALAIVSGHAAWLATDRLGTHPLYYARPAEGGIAFDTSAARLARTPGVDGRIEPQALYDYLHFHVIPAPGTLYRGVRRLLPGTCLRAAPDGAHELRYWQPEYRPHGMDRREAARRFRDAVFAAVERACGDGGAGAFLSGGTDSSTIVGAMARLAGSAAPAYSIGFDVPGYDETEYARIAAKHFGVRHRVHYLTPGEVAEAIPAVAGELDQPFGNASIVPARQCAVLAAEDGVERLLGGDGGDELFGGNTRYAKQRLFELYGRLPHALRRGVDPLADRLPARGPLRKLRSYVGQARTPLPDRLESYNLLERLGPAEVLAPGLIDAVDPERPRERMRRAYAEVAAGDYVNRLLGLDLRFTLADNDLVKVRQAAAMAGLGATFPFLDDDVVALSLELPVDWKVRRNALRPFFKEALSEFLPREVIDKRKHGFGLPFGAWLAETEALNSVAREALLGLEQRRILRPGFARRLLDTELARHPGYYGAFVWVLMILGQWLDAHGFPREPVV